MDVVMCSASSGANDIVTNDVSRCCGETLTRPAARKKASDSGLLTGGFLAQTPSPACKAGSESAAGSMIQAWQLVPPRAMPKKPSIKPAIASSQTLPSSSAAGRTTNLRYCLVKFVTKISRARANCAAGSSSSSSASSPDTGVGFASAADNVVGVAGAVTSPPAWTGSDVSATEYGFHIANQPRRQLVVFHELRELASLFLFGLEAQLVHDRFAEA